MWLSVTKKIISLAYIIELPCLQFFQSVIGISQKQKRSFEFPNFGNVRSFTRILVKTEFKILKIFFLAF